MTIKHPSPTRSLFAQNARDLPKDRRVVAPPPCLYLGELLRQARRVEGSIEPSLGHEVEDLDLAGLLNEAIASTVAQRHSKQR